MEISECLLDETYTAFLLVDFYYLAYLSGIIFQVSQIDPHLMYFVKIGFKKNLPVPTKHLLPLYAFIRHFLKIRSTQVIPALE